MILAGSRGNSTKCSILRPAIPDPASRVQKLLAPLPVRLDDRWDRTTVTWSCWAVLYPRAEIPAVQLSIDETQPSSFHYEIGSAWRLYAKRVFSSSEVVTWCTTSMPMREDGTFKSHTIGAISFEKRVRELLLAEEYTPLVNYENQLGREADLAVPTPDHYLPLLYVIGTRIPSEASHISSRGVDGGSVSMLAVRVG